MTLQSAEMSTGTLAGDILRSLVYMPVFYIGSIPFILWGATAGSFSVVQLRAAVRGWSRFHRWCVTDICRIKVVEANRPPDQPVLYVIKHESFFEAIDMPGLLPRPVVFAKAELMQIPVWGLVARRFGLVAVERDQGAKALRGMIGAAKAAVADNRPLALFPEGTRVHHGEKPPLQSGFAGLYKLLNLPVVPVAVNSGPLFRSWIKRRGTITYRFGDMIPPGLDRYEAEARVQAAINALNGPV